MDEKESKAGVSLFPIRELSMRTKVNTVTIRAWERRYGLLSPARTSKGHRLYSGDDVATVERILAFVARGVPLGKVKALLDEGELIEIPDDSGDWFDATQRFVEAVRDFSSSRVEHLIDEFFLNYPPRVCRERLIEPCLELLAQFDTSKAAYLFAESELIRYAVLRLNSKEAKKGRSPLVLMSGENTPLWRLSIVAMELADANYSVQLMNRTFSVVAGAAMSAQLDEATTVFYQDGLWRETEVEVVAAALAARNNILFCGTAGALANLNNGQQVFPDLDRCIAFLLNQTSVVSAD